MEKGVVFSSVWRLFFSEKEVKVIIIGLDNAGKTTTLYKLFVMIIHINNNNKL